MGNTKIEQTLLLAKTQTKKCPYCSVWRKTKIGLKEHIGNMHPGKVTKSGILLP